MACSEQMKYDDPSVKCVLMTQADHNFVFYRSCDPCLEILTDSGCVCEGGPGRPCARGLQAPVFAALARERARLPGVKYDAAAWPWRNAARLPFYAARLARAQQACGRDMSVRQRMLACSEPNEISEQTGSVSTITKQSHVHALGLATCSLAAQVQPGSSQKLTNRAHSECIQLYLILKS